jgi:hypothetical protein
LTDVDTLGSHSESYIDPIIDQEGYPMLPGKIVQLFGGLDQLRGLTYLVTILEDGNTWYE